MADHPRVTMTAYRKFTDALRENRDQGPPKPPKDSEADAGRTLDALGALGGTRPQNRNASAADTKGEPAPDRTHPEAEGDFRDCTHGHLKHLKHLKHLNHLKLRPSWDTAEYGGGIPRTWVEGFARLHPDRPPGDVPLRRWQAFIDDIGRFLDGSWAEKATALSWGPLDLFGCDRDRPFARIDHAGLLWLLNGDRLVDLDRHEAVIETRTGARQTFRRRPLAVGDVVLAWELAE
jgi:hypothetical protein